MIPTIEDFLAKWEAPFRQAHEALNLFSEAPQKTVMAFHPIATLTYEERLSRQKHWLSELEKMEPTDQSFFEHCWVPVQSFFSIWYIDLSQAGFPFFSVFTIPDNPEPWHKIVLYKKLSDLLMDTMNGLNWKELVFNMIIKEMVIISEDDAEKNQLMWEGKMPLPKFDIESLFVNDKKQYPVEIPEIDSFMLPEALPESIGLFGPDTLISVVSIKTIVTGDISLEDFNNLCSEIVNTEEADDEEEEDEDEEEDEYGLFEFVETDPRDYKDIDTIQKLMVFIFRQSSQRYMLFQFELIEYDATVWLNEKHELLVIGHDKEKLSVILSHVREAIDQILPEAS